MIKYEGLVIGKNHPAFYLVPARGFVSPSGVASAVTYAIRYDLNKRGLDTDEEELREAAYAALQLDAHIEQDVNTIYPGFYFAFTFKQEAS